MLRSGPRGKSRLPEACAEDALRLYGFWQRDGVEFQAFEAEQLCCEAGPEGNPAYPNLVQV